MAISFDLIVSQWIPIFFASIGIIMFLAGVFRMIANKDGAFSNMFTGIIVVAIAIAFRWAAINFILPNI